MKSYEVNFDGLVGPTHNYGGLSYGNVASQSNSQQSSNPKEAALQGLAKMKALMEMGFQQGVLAPQERPDVAALRRLGFSGTDAQVIERAAKDAMPLLVASCSASSMWVANAATVSPSADTADGRVHFTAANLNCKYHRSIEHPTTSRVLGAMFADQKHFAHHAALPAVAQFGDEGAANHTVSAVSTVRPALSSSSSVAARSIPATRRRRSTRRARPSKRHRPLPGCTA
jgi:succinylarginine dihydrolase